MHVVIGRIVSISILLWILFLLLPCPPSSDMSFNSFNAADAAVLGDAFKSNSALSIVNFYGNYVGMTGASALGDGIKASSSISTFTMLPVADVRASRIEILHLSHQHVDDCHAIVLCT